VVLNNRIGANVEGRGFFEADGIPPFSPLKGGRVNLQPEPLGSELLYPEVVWKAS